MSTNLTVWPSDSDSPRGIYEFQIGKNARFDYAHTPNKSFTEFWISNAFKNSFENSISWAVDLLTGFRFVCVCVFHALSITLFNSCRSIVFGPHIFGRDGALGRQYRLYQQTEELVCRSKALGCTFWGQNIHIPTRCTMFVCWCSSISAVNSVRDKNK